MRRWDAKEYFEEAISSSMCNWTLKITKGSPQRLADILEMDAESGWEWKTEELGCIFQHQMQLTVQAGLLELSPLLPAGLKRILQYDEQLPQSFGELFFTCKANPKILKWIQTLTLRCLEQRTSPLPRQVLQLIACLAEAADGLTCSRSKQSVLKSNRSHQKVLKFSWLDTSCRTMLLKYLGLISSPERKASESKKRKLSVAL